jgi:hypothetical protein
MTLKLKCKCVTEDSAKSILHSYYNGLGTICVDEEGFYCVYIGQTEGVLNGPFLDKADADPKHYGRVKIYGKEEVDDWRDKDCCDCRYRTYGQCRKNPPDHQGYPTVLHVYPAPGGASNVFTRACSLYEKIESSTKI